MKASALYGLALIFGTVASIVTMSLHPTSVSALASPEALMHEMRVLVAVHTLALLSIPLMVFGFAGVTHRLGWERPAALFAFVLYAFSAIAIMFAAIADGLINAALMPKMISAPESELQILKAALAYNFQLNQACAKVFVVGSSLAFIFWSAALLRAGTFGRRVAAVGWFTGGIALLGLLSGHVRMSAHGFALIVFLQAVWVVLLAVWMLRAERHDPAVETARQVSTAA
jgi:hypothetical protein